MVAMALPGHLQQRPVCQDRGHGDALHVRQRVTADAAHLKATLPTSATGSAAIGKIHGPVGPMRRRFQSRIPIVPIWPSPNRFSSIASHLLIVTCIDSNFGIPIPIFSFRPSFQFPFQFQCP
jgi:hypothetical protein